MVEIGNLFKFLKEFNEISNPVITTVEKQRWSLKISDIPNINEISTIYETKDFEGDFIVEVKRPTLEPCPKPDDILKDWINSEYNDYSIEEIIYIEEKSKILKDKDGNIATDEFGTVITETESFIDDHERELKYKEWVLKRSYWRKEQIIKSKGLEVYNNLYKLYSEIKRESENVELVLGDGKIKWENIDEELNIDHPVFLQKVNLEFDIDKPSFIIKCDDIKIDLYTSLLRIMKTVNQEILATVIEDIEKTEFHIADINNVQGLFKRLINVIHKNGTLVEKSKANEEYPVIYHEPVLFLRKRNLGHSIFIDRIINNIEENPNIDIPGFFKVMLGDHSTSNFDRDLVQGDWNENGLDKDVLLTLPANKEQLRIIKYLDEYGAVLVQGPPGTGKTHTIANLIGHLLSQGNSVLVTSHTEKALSVLKEKVYDEIQSLCISLLSSASQKKEMNNALFDIAEKATSLDENASVENIQRLSSEREILIEKLKLENEQLLEIRGLEYKDIVYDNTCYTPIEAAKFLNAGIGKIDYIKGQTTNNTISLPIDLEKLRWLYSSNQLISTQEEINLMKDRPSLDQIWDPTKFTEKVSKYYYIYRRFKGMEM
jgi:hypothetical protein